MISAPVWVDKKIHSTNCITFDALPFVKSWQHEMTTLMVEDTVR